jgi:hypothetical protein
VISAWLLFTSFTFYVTFVQYALLRRAEFTLYLSEQDLLPGLALLAVFGIAGSLWAGRLIDRHRPTITDLTKHAGRLSAMLAVAAVWAMNAEAVKWVNLSFAPMGVLLGLLIVVLLYLFGACVPETQWGSTAGIVAGMVYLMSSLLGGFSPKPEDIGLFDAGLLLSNAVLVVVLRKRLREPAAVALGRDTSFGGMLESLWLLALIVLVDTALFVVISRSTSSAPVLGTSRQWIVFGMAHVAASLVAGWAYRALGWRRIVYIAAGCLAALIGLFVAHRLGVTGLAWPMLVLYGAVVGLYTVSLFTAFAVETPRDRPATGIAAGIILVGWLCSPAGIALGNAVLNWL